MKKIYFLILFTLQFSLYCYSQSDDTIHQYTDAEILKISNYVKELEAKVPGINLSDPDKAYREKIAEFFTRNPHTYSNSEVVMLAGYIKHLENPAAFPSVASADSLTRYTNPEIAKFAKYIGTLEKRISTNTSLQADPEEKRKITELLNSPTHEYKDEEIIMLANYIKGLEKLDSTNTFMIAKASQDSLAMVGVKTVVEKKIDEFSKLIFFNFNSASLKPESYKPLDEVVKLVNSQDQSFVVEGYCDNVGSDEYNLKLSERRVESVKNYLISKGVKSGQISAKGYGEANPIATNDTEEGRAKNRRVEINSKK